MRRAVWALLAGTAASLAPVVAEARPGDRIGEAVLVVNQVTAELSRDVRTLITGDPVRHSEIVVAGADARTELKLDDDTKLALGPGARLRLDKFVYDPDRHKGSILVDLVKGTFRFMTGIASKPSYLIRTPTAAITVRGTIFDVFVRKNGETWVLLSEGGIEACTRSGTCRVLDKPGSILAITAAGEVGAPSCWQRFGADLDFSFDQAFPFVSRPPTIDRSPVFTRTALTGDEACASQPKVRRADAGPPARDPKPVVKQPKVEPKLSRQARYEPDLEPRSKRVVKVVPEYEAERRRPPIKIVTMPPIDYRPPVIRFPQRPRMPDMDGNWPGYPKYPGKLPKFPRLPTGGYDKVPSLPSMPTKYPSRIPANFPSKMPGMPSKIGGYGGSVLR